MTTQTPDGLDFRIYGVLPGNLDELRAASEANPNWLDDDTYLLETNAFVKLFNQLAEEFSHPGWKISLRTLRFYSSPRLRVMPPPLKRAGQGQRGYYVVPHHIWRLETIQSIKERHYLPLWLIREIMAVAGPYELNSDHLDVLKDLPTNQLLNALPLCKKMSVDHLRALLFCRLLIGADTINPRTGSPDPRMPFFELFAGEVERSLNALRHWLTLPEAKETWTAFEKAKEDPETKAVIQNIQSFKKRLLRRK